MNRPSLKLPPAPRMLDLIGKRNRTIRANSWPGTSGPFPVVAGRSRASCGANEVTSVRLAMTTGGVTAADSPARPTPGGVQAADNPARTTAGVTPVSPAATVASYSAAGRRGRPVRSAHWRTTSS